MKFLKIFILLFICIALKSQAQNTKVYSGDMALPSTIFPLYNGEIGTVNYKYSISNGKRVWNGPFSFNLKSRNLNISGAFEENEPNGKWTLKYRLGNFDDCHYTKYYSDGELSGAYSFNYTKQGYRTKLVYSMSGNMQNNHPVGKLCIIIKAYKNNSLVKTDSITGDFNEEGKAHGTWRVPQMDNTRFTDIYIYDNGTLLTYERYDDSTGESEILYQKEVRAADTSRRTSIRVNLGPRYYPLGTPFDQEVMPYLYAWIDFSKSFNDIIATN